MATLSYSLHERIIGWLKGDDFGPAPTSLKLGLLTAAPNPDGTGVTEPAGPSGYLRQDVTLGSLSVSGGITTVKNASPLIFPVATADWDAVTYGAVFGDDGEMLAYGPLPASRVCKAGDAISFGANAIQLRLR